MTELLVALALCIIGALVSVVGPGRIGRIGGFAFLGVAAVASLAAALRGLGGSVQTFYLAYPQTHIALRLDATAAFFIGILGLVALIVALFAVGRRSSDERRSGRTASASACAIFFASVLACSAGDVLLFIFAWELLALTFYWAIAYAGTDPDAAASAYVTIAVTHIAGACMVAALLFLARGANGFEVIAVTGAGTNLTGPAAGVVLVLLLVGFGAKFGMLPMQAWLPYGYGSAPSVVAALMAGGALNVGFYGVTRFVVGFPNAPLWLGIVAIVIGALSAFFGIAWAAAQLDMRRLAAFSSVENGGIILAALGVAIAGQALHQPLLAGFGIAAAFIQIAAHAVAKSTLFLTISVIADECASVSLDALGGLSRRLPFTTVAIVLCGVSLAALPPLAGFVGEWLVLEALMQAFRTANVACEVAFALAGATIGVAAGIAVVTFTKLIGTSVLGAPRLDREERDEGGRSPMRAVGLAVGALSIVAIGVFAAPLLRLIGPSIDGIAGVSATSAMIGTFPLVQPTFGGFSSISPSGLGLVLIAFTLFFWIVARCFSRPQVREAAAWTSGEPYRARTQYTGTGYVNPTRVILDAAVRTVREVGVRDGVKTYKSFIRPFFDLPFYRAMAAPFLYVGSFVRDTQSGVIAAYLSYILAFTIVLLILFPSIRHW
ncbi:MAG TPA: proton-conducting transporter membrane subunit [Candidatus Acidoferrales bacterium]|nr:proton-conducting transporter membrane subunit [Candidatus Acidoferrales bacterium]